jgi:hypothetical protein
MLDLTEKQPPNPPQAKSEKPKPKTPPMPPISIQQQATDGQTSPSHQSQPKSQPDGPQASDAAAVPSNADNLGAGFDTVDFGKFTYEGEVKSEGQTGQGEEEQTTTSKPEILSKAAFRKMFGGMFEIGHQLTKLDSLKVKPDEVEGANNCYDAIHDIALDVPALRFLIEPGNVWIQRSMAIGFFVVPKTLAIRAELEFRRNSKEQQPHQQTSGVTESEPPKGGNNDQPATSKTTIITKDGREYDAE